MRLPFFELTETFCKLRLNLCQSRSPTVQNPQQNFRYNLNGAFLKNPAKHHNTAFVTLNSNFFWQPFNKILRALL